MSVKDGRMKWICLLVVLWQGVLSGTEVRSYQVGKEAVMKSLYCGDPFGPPVVPVEAGSVLTKSPFESRFLKEAELVWDCSAEIGKLLGKEKWTGFAVVDEEGAHLVVKAEVRDHIEIAKIFEPDMETVQTKVALYRVQGVTIGRDKRSLEEIEKGELLVGLTCLHYVAYSYEARAGDFSIEGEMFTDSDGEILENRISWASEIKGCEFQLKAGFCLKRGEPFIIELGSKDGVSSMFAVMTQDLVLLNGVSFDEWILKEEGGAFLKENRIKGEKEFVGLPESDRVWSFTVPPTLIELLSPPSGHPEGVLYDVKELFEEVGISFEKEDTALFSKRYSILLLKTSRLNKELIVDFMMGRGDPSVHMHFTFVKVASEKKVTSQMEEVEVKEKVGIVILPGQLGSFQLGEGLFGKVEANIDLDSLIEGRINLASDADFSEVFYKTEVVLKNGRSVVIQQSREGGSGRPGL